MLKQTPLSEASVPRSLLSCRRKASIGLTNRHRHRHRLLGGGNFEVLPSISELMRCKACVASIPFGNTASLPLKPNVLSVHSDVESTIQHRPARPRWPRPRPTASVRLKSSRCRRWTRARSGFRGRKPFFPTITSRCRGRKRVLSCRCALHCC